MNRQAIKSKDTVILHIGMAKTATTSIQTGLKGFTDGDTRYARLGSSNHSIPLITAFRKDPSRHLYYVKRGMDQATVKKVGIEIREKLLREMQSPERNLVFSGEELCRLTPGEVRRMKTFMDPHCGRFRVLAYIREPLGFASSVYQQVARHRQITELSVPVPHYRRWFAKYIEIFGRQTVEFVLFDPATFRDACIITDFCDRVGIAANRIAKSTRNQSLSTEAVALLVDWNRHGIKSSESLDEVRAMNRLISHCSSCTVMRSASVIFVVSGWSSIIGQPGVLPAERKSRNCQI